MELSVQSPSVLAYELMKRFDFFKEIYFKEIERKISSDNSLTMPIGIITLVGTVLSNMLLNFNYRESLINLIIFVLFVTLTFIFLGITVFQLMKAYNMLHKGYEYKYLPFSSLMERYFVDLREFYDKNETDEKARKKNLDKEYEDYLIDQLVQCSDNNIKHNDKKTYHLFQAKKSLIASVFAVFICLFPYGYNYFTYNDKGRPTRVHIINPVEISNYPEYTIIRNKKTKELTIKPCQKKMTQNPKLIQDQLFNPQNLKNRH